MASLFLLLLPASAADTGFNGRWNITVGGGDAGKTWHALEKIGASPRGTVWWLEIEGAGTPGLRGRFVSAYGGRTNTIEEISLREGELTFGFIRRERPPDGAAPRSDHLVYTARLSNGRLEGTFRIEGQAEPPVPWTGVRAPVIDEKDDGTWKEGKPIRLFNGKDLSGWRLLVPRGPLVWEVRDGVLIQGGAGGANNLITERKFWNFKLHVEFKVGEGANSGIGLRGRYEIQILDDYDKPSDMHGNGALYSRIAPSVKANKPAGEWQAFDIRLVGRILTVALNGQTIIDHREIEGLTAAAMDAEEAQPGPILLQSARPRLEFRNIVLTPLTR